MGQVAVSKIKHDGKVFQPGEKVSGLDEETMRSLWEAGSVVDEKDYEAPTGREEYPTTPRVVRESLQRQAAEANAPGGGHREGVLTQPKAEAPSDPAALLSTTESADTSKGTTAKSSSKSGGSVPKQRGSSESAEDTKSNA